MTPNFPSDERWFTPPRLAHQLGVSVDKVLTWIRNGELRAVNVAEHRDGRPRWRISPAALDEFLKRRESSPPPPPRAYRFRRMDNAGRGGKVTRDSDGRLGKNIPHEVRVKRMAILMAAGRSGQGAEWRPFVPIAVARYAEKTGVEVDAETVLSLKAWWEED